MGYAYADFGLGGVFLSAILVGAVLQSLHVYCVRGPKGALYLARYILLVWLGFAYCQTSITTGLISK